MVTTTRPMEYVRMSSVALVAYANVSRMVAIHHDRPALTHITFYSPEELQQAFDSPGELVREVGLLKQYLDSQVIEYPIVLAMTNDSAVGQLLLDWGFIALCV